MERIEERHQKPFDSFYTRPLKVFDFIDTNPGFLKDIS